MKLSKTILSIAVCLTAAFSASAQGPMGGGFPGGGMPPMGGFPGFNSSNSDATAKQDESYSKKLEKILTPEQFQDWQSHQAAKAMKPEGPKPDEANAEKPENVNPDEMPGDFFPGGPGFGPGRRPGMQEADEDSDSDSKDEAMSAADLKNAAKAKTDRMAKELNLTDAQYKKVLKLNTNDMRIRQNSSSQSMGGFPGGPMGGPMGGGPRF